MRSRLADALLLALILPSAVTFAQSIPAATAEAGAPLPLFLEVRMNQARSGPLLPFESRNGRLWATVATLRQAGFSLPGQDASEWIALDAIEGARYDYNAAEQRITIDAPLSSLALETTVIDTAAMDVPTATRSNGALLNYDIYASRDDGGENLSTFAELRLLGGAGVFSQTAVNRAFRRDDDASGGWRGESVRLDTQFRWSDPGSMLSVSAGDNISGSLSWTRPVRFGGISIARDFSLQPYRVTTPLPSFVGEAAVPSSVELYVDGIRQYSGEVPVGSFQLNAMPGVSGAGVAQMVVTDAFGATRTIDFPFYTTQTLLADGLSDWSFDLGTVRKDYGLASFDYQGAIVASAVYRHGVTRSLTVEGHGEGGDGLANAGAGAFWEAGRLGVFNASAAHGSAGGDDGWLYGLGYQWSNRRFNVSIDSLRTRGDYRDIASLYGEAPASISDRALLGWSLPAAGSLSLSYVRLAYAGDTESRYAGANWSRNFGRRWYLNLSMSQNLDDRDDRSYFIGATYNFEDRTLATASLQRSADSVDTVLDVTRPVPGDGGFGWRAQARAGDSGDSGLLELGWLANAGRLDLGLARLQSGEQAYAHANGGLVLMGGHLFASRYVNDAFAVVDTGLPGVPVRLENRDIGRTDADGTLLVTRLNAWQHNRISIDPMGLPADIRVDAVSRDVTPADRGGALVRFDLERVRAALLVLVDGDGQPLPLGSQVRLAGSNDAAIVGYDGETYVEGLGGPNILRVDAPSGPCTARFNYPADTAGIPRIGPLSCLPEPTR